jgi:hypothetical protein
VKALGRTALIPMLELEWQIYILYCLISNKDARALEYDKEDIDSRGSN